MKKIILVVLIFLLAFAFIRITTSTYENIKRRNNTQVMFAEYCKKTFELQLH